MYSTTIAYVLQQIGDEVARAENLHAPINSAHEGYSVILEELDEFWEQVRLKRAARDPEKMRRELIETAAMCVRTIRDVIDRDRATAAGYWRERASELAKVASLVSQITLGDVDRHVGTGEPYFEAHIPCEAWAELDAILSPFRVPCSVSAE